jgi:hypothetical protein
VEAGSPIFAVRIVFYLILDHANHDVVRDQASGIYDLLGLYTQRCLSLDLLAQHVTGGQMTDTELIADPWSLGSLAWSYPHCFVGRLFE